MSDLTYHYPPEVMDLLIETIPLICKSKQDVLTFFRGAGVPDSTTALLRMRVTTDRASINKYEMTRAVLKAINEGGDVALGQRREVIKRVTGFEEFSLCWPGDRDRAEALVGRLRKAVQTKDSFTTMRMERDAERRERLRTQEAAAEEKRRKRQERQELRSRLAALTQMANPQERGIALEPILNQIFALDGLSVREAFTIRGDDGQVKEQIDGLVAVGTQLVLVEMKYHTEPIGRGDVVSHLVSVYGRPDVYGLFVSFSRITAPAIQEFRNALPNKVVMLAEIYELMMLLENSDTTVNKWLKAKITAARIEREPLYRPDPAALRT